MQLFHEPDERFWLGAGITRSRRFLVIGLGSSITSEEFLVDLDDLTAPPRVVWPRREGVEYSVEHAVVDGRDELLILHNDDALDFELVSVSVSDPSGPRRTVLPHTPGRRLLDVDAFRDVTVVAYRLEGLERIALMDPATGALDELGFDEPLYSAGFGGNPEWAAPFLRLGYGSFVTPSTVYDLELATGELHLRKRQPRARRLRPADYGQRRDWALAEDGTRVPISLVWKRSFGDAGRGPRPVHLYGYGIVRALDRPRLLGHPPFRARSRGRVRGGARARRRRDGPPVVRGRQARTEDEHVHRLRRLRPAPGRRGRHGSRPDGRGGRQRRRPAHGRRREPRTGAVQRDPRRPSRSSTR